MIDEEIERNEKMEINTGARKIPNADSFREKTASFISSLNDMIRSHCSEELIPWVDTYRDLGARDRPDILDPEYAIGDNAHLNIDGQRRVAVSFLDGYFREVDEFDLVVCMGDSHTQGYPVRLDTSRNGEPIELEVDNSHQFPYWLAESTGKTFINRGISGNTFLGMKKRFEKEVIPHLPDHCIILGGTNDALLGTPMEDSARDLFEMIDICLENEITPVVGTTIPLGF